ncbi:MAG: T9SS type A sorting domain-containing protein [candidate division WOR-3 bacterium]|nr:MAG: T9SS type A sorting domain-containing protein [candidate division WOR-3 bacterium]
MAVGEDRARRGARPSSLSVCSGILRLPGKQTADLLDIAGRRVTDLQPGLNDIRRVAPGVYFVRGPETEDGRPKVETRKVVIQR